MNSLERILSVLNFGTPDRVPVLPQIFGHAAVVDGVSLRNYVQDGSEMAECQINAIKKYGHDAVFAVMDMCVETEAVGSLIEYKEDIYPTVKEYICSKKNIEELSLPDPTTDGRMPEILRAISILTDRIGAEYLIVGCVCGPMTLTTQLIGAERALYLAIDEPEQFNKLLDFATEVVIEFGLAQIEAGAHSPMVFDPSGSPAFIPEQFFREIELPRLQRVFNAFSEAGCLANWLHIAGPTAAILPYYSQLNIDIANFDYYVAPEQAAKLLPETCLDGNIKSISFIEDKPEEIRNKSYELLNFFSSRGGYLLSSGCEISPEAKPENIEALVNTTR